MIKAIRMMIEQGCDEVLLNYSQLVCWTHSQKRFFKKHIGWHQKIFYALSKSFDVLNENKNIWFGGTRTFMSLRMN